MRPPVETVRISRQGKDQLLKLRRQTGIEHWNVLCRWAFCVSLRDPKPPTPSLEKLDGGVEMTWKVFAGEQSDIYAALTQLRASQDDFPTSPDGAAACLRAHLHRGLSYLASGTTTRSLSDLTRRWLTTAN
ncbi:DNA sulfur modification protein DndE [Methylotetracoccus oryzae]|uniref:DNA sulfur modification protein DndE n=1 Tax=Methylotetracoccus oryzae TaxID=1919059 RepID=UPI00111BCC0D